MAQPLALVWDLIARDGASGTFARVAASADKAAAATGRAEAGVVGFGKKAAAALGALIAVDVAAHFIKDAAKFQQQMLLIQTLTGGTTAEVKNMSAAVLSLAGQVGQSPEHLATSLYHVESVGLRGAKAMEVVKIAAQGAKVGMADLEETTNALTSTVASGIPGVKNMSQAMGALVTIVGAGDMKMSDLNEALGGGILSVVKGYGLTLNDVGAALATFGDNNIRGADAATALRMAVQSLAVPAAKGKDAIESIGLTMNTLQKDMQKGGLNKALLDLNDHLHAAGITGVQVGGYLTEAFGKRAGIGLSVLMGQIDRFESKVVAVREGASGFGSAWEQTTHTAAFAFDRLKAQFETFAIAVGTQLLPIVTKAADWLGNTLPHAIGTLRGILAPLADVVGAVLVRAWHAFVAVVSAAKDAISGISSLLKDHKVLVGGVATSIAAMWLAYKGYQIARAAIRVMSSAMQTLALKAMYARDSMIAASESASTMGIAANAALGLIGIAVGVATLAWMHHASVVAATKQRIEELTTAYKEDNGAIAANTTAVIANQLMKSGAVKAARELGLSLSDLTLATEGNRAALGRINAAHDAYNRVSARTIYLSQHGTALQKEYAGAALEGGHALSRQQDLWEKVYGTIGDTHGNLKKAVQDYKDLGELSAKHDDNVKVSVKLTAEQLQYQKDLKRAMGEAHVEIDGVTYAMRGQATAADVLNAAIARLSGDKNAVAESELAFEDSLAAVTEKIKEQAKQYKDHGTSLKANTAEGRANLEWLHSQVDQINGIASAQIKAGTSATTVATTMSKYEDKLRAAGKAAGFSTDQVDAFLKKFAVKPKDLIVAIKANTDPAATAALALDKKLKTLTKARVAIIKLGGHAGSSAQADNLQTQLDTVNAQLDSLTVTRTIPIDVAMTSKAVQALHRLNVGNNANGTNYWRGGTTWVGERGPELVTLPRGSQVLNHQASMKAAGGGGGVSVTQNFYNATKETPSVSASAALRAKTLTLGKR